MEKKKIHKESGEISRREFLKDAGLVVGGAAIGSAVILAACGAEETTETVTETATQTATQTQTKTATATVTTTAPGATSTVTTTAPGGTIISTVTETVSKFVCPYCSEEFTTLSALQSHVEAEHAGEVPAALNVVKLTINGEQYELQVKPEDTLRDLLRLKLGLTSVKDMCVEFGACGSCTVIMDGRPILSCMALAIECDGATIETAEGMLAAKHPLIEMYVKHAALQCGFCTPGFVVTAKALLDRDPNPTEADIREALGGNICRCASYPGHIPAVLEAAEMLGGS